jgi:hypothetical protein
MLEGPCLREHYGEGRWREEDCGERWGGKRTVERGWGGTLREGAGRGLERQGRVFELGG